MFWLSDDLRFFHASISINSVSINHKMDLTSFYDICINLKFWSLHLTQGIWRNLVPFGFEY